VAFTPTRLHQTKTSPNHHQTITKPSPNHHQTTPTWAEVAQLACLSTRFWLHQQIASQKEKERTNDHVSIELHAILHTNQHRPKLVEVERDVLACIRPRA
jgi:hypothetical protein